MNVSGLNIKSVLGGFWDIVKTNPKPWVIGVIGTSILGVYSSQWGSLENAKNVVNPVDPRVTALNAYQEADLIKSQQEGLTKVENALTKFLSDDQQRTDIAMAQQYRVMALYFSSIPNHPCSGKREIECLNTFMGNRQSDFEAGAQPIVNPQSDPAVSINKLLEDNNNLAKTRAVRLAIVLATPAPSRTEAQNNILLSYSLLETGLPAEELEPRPLTAAQWIAKLRSEREALLGTSKEEVNRIEGCLSLTPEQRSQTPNCQ